MSLHYFFEGCKSVEEIKTLYRQLAMQYHPDRGGDTATMQEINRQYFDILKTFDGTESKDQKGKTHRYTYWYEREQAIVEKIYETLRELAGTDCEVFLIGVWIWVFGDTKPHKDILNKKLGYNYMKHRQAWAWKPYKGRTRKSSAGLEYIAAKYGAQKVTRKDDKKEDARQERPQKQNVPTRRTGSQQLALL